MSTNLLGLLEHAKKAAPGAKWLGLRRRLSTQRVLMARDGVLEFAGEGQDEGIMVEAFVAGQFGYAASSDTSPEAIARAALLAYESAKAASKYPVHRFTLAVRPPSQVKWRSKELKKAELPVDLVYDFLSKSCSTLKVSDSVIQTSAMVENGRYDYEIVSTNGANIEQTINFVGVSLQAIARDGTIIQRRTANGPRSLIYQGGWELFNTEKLLQKAMKVGEEAVELLSAESCPDDRRTLVLAPDQMMLQIHESVGHPLEIDRILGDERNYAGSSFVKLSDIGSFQYGSELMNISFDPGIEGEFASYGADEIGNLARKELIIKNGVLVAGLGSLESQARANVPGVANQRASSWDRPPMDRMANLNMEPGSSSLESIISGIEKGVFMDANRSWSIDDYRNKFQFGCEYGRLIEDGQLTRTVRDPNYRGISSSFWRNLSAVGDASTFEHFGTPNCGKGEPNQVIFVGHASPVCAFSDVEVFGGAS